MRIFLALVIATLAGCSDEPKAPPLVREAVYQNADAGVRFMSPQGWTMTSRSSLPDGTLPIPVRLVNYIRTRGDQPAELAVVVAENPDDMKRFLGEYRLGAEKWTVQDATESLTIDNQSATRYTLKRSDGKPNVVREVTASSHRGRAVLFYLTYGPRDGDNRDVGRGSIASAVWMP